MVPMDVSTPTDGKRKIEDDDKEESEMDGEDLDMMNELQLAENMVTSTESAWKNAKMFRDALLRKADRKRQEKRAKRAAKRRAEGNGDVPEAMDGKDSAEKKSDAANSLESANSNTPLLAELQIGEGTSSETSAEENSKPGSPIVVIRATDIQRLEKELKPALDKIYTLMVTMKIDLNTIQDQNRKAKAHTNCAAPQNMPSTSMFIPQPVVATPQITLADVNNILMAQSIMASRYSAYQVPTNASAFQQPSVKNNAQNGGNIDEDGESSGDDDDESGSQSGDNENAGDDDDIEIIWDKKALKKAEEQAQAQAQVEAQGNEQAQRNREEPANEQEQGNDEAQGNEPGPANEQEKAPVQEQEQEAPSTS